MSARRFTGQAAELAIAAPQVVAHRVARMARAGPAPSTRDRRELYLMGSEKIWAFYESWFAMTQGLARLYQEAWIAGFRSLLGPWSVVRRGSFPAPLGLQRAGIDVLSRGLEPVRRRAVRNAKRLKRTRRR